MASEPPACPTAAARLKLREPFCGISHLAGAVLGVAALIVLVSMARGKPWHLSAFAIYGTTVILLYLASALYHSLPVGERHIARLRILDHVGIYLLIAGTYTPICLVALRGPWGWSLFGVIWALALLGSLCAILWRTSQCAFGIGLYVVMGWLAIIAPRPLMETITGAGFAWLLAGGVIYTVGAVILAIDRPRLWPGVFGSHDLWHLFVLGGSACHFVVMLWFVAPLP